MTQSQQRIFKADFFKALANPVRIAILDHLREGEQNVSELASRFEIEQAGVSQHLAVLRAKGIVTARKQGNHVYYAVRDSAIFDLLDDAARIFRNQLSAVQEHFDASHS